MVSDAIIDALVTIGNHPEIAKECEPNVMQPLGLDEWMVKRTLYALLTFQGTWDKMRANEGE